MDILSNVSEEEDQITDDQTDRVLQEIISEQKKVAAKETGKRPPFSSNLTRREAGGRVQGEVGV